MWVTKHFQNLAVILALGTEETNAETLKLPVVDLGYSLHQARYSLVSQFYQACFECF